jgi:hypothetical protein
LNYFAIGRAILRTRNIQSGSGDIFGVDRRIASIALSVLIALKIAILFAFAWHSRFVMDEFVQLGWAKYLGHGLFDTIWHAKAVGYAVFYKLAHLIGWNGTSILLIGRVQTALLACATLAIVYGCARALGNDRLRSLAIVLVLLCFSNFMERIFRTIAEPLALFFAAIALLVVLRGRADQARTVIVAGVLSGLSFLATQKAVYFNVALGLALVGDAALARQYVDAVKRGGWLVLGWALPIVAYCFIFGGSDPVPIAKNLAFGPVEIATTGQDSYNNLRSYVEQTLFRNAVLYIFCFVGMILGLLRITRMDERNRIALIFAIIITALVFTHNQPWPYVFIMALPFMALWSLTPLDRIASRKLYLGAAWAVLCIAIVGSFVRNAQYLRIDNKAQLELVARAESLIGLNEIYFDGIGMLPNRMEPSILWLDRIYVLKTLREGNRSEAYRILANTPPKVILWSYRMDAIDPVVAPLIRNSYVQIAPNLRIAGRRLRLGESATFNVPIPGRFQLYSETGTPLPGRVEVDGRVKAPPFHLAGGKRTVTLRSGPAGALLLPEGSYAGTIKAGNDNGRLFEGVYN